MSILIKGLEMPKGCNQCWFYGFDPKDDPYCWLLKGNLPLPDRIPQDCPLIPVPEHGRLIDADALVNRLENAKTIKPHLESGINVAVAFLYTAPTVIEADRGCDG